MSETDNFVSYDIGLTDPVSEPQPVDPQQEKADEEAARTIRMRQYAYARWMEGIATPDDIQVVVDDLARFCRAYDSCFVEGPEHAARLDGRREVYLRIVEFSTLSHDALMMRYHMGAKIGN